MSDTTLWIMFVVFAIAGIGVFLYAFRSLGPRRDAEQRIIELQDQAEEGEE